MRRLFYILIMALPIVWIRMSGVYYPDASWWQMVLIYMPMWIAIELSPYLKEKLKVD